MSALVEVAGFLIRVDGVPLSPTQASRIQSIQVVEDVGALSTFSLQLTCWDAQQGRYMAEEAGPFKLGSQVVIRLGFGGNLVTVMEGDVVEHALQLSAGAAPSLTVHGFCPLHRLDRGTASRRWDSVTEQALLDELVTPYGLSASAQNQPQPDLEVVQEQQSDLAFLRSRAVMLGYELLYANGLVSFHPARRQHGAGVTLRGDREILEFSGRMNLRGQVDQVFCTYFDADRERQALTCSYRGAADSGPLLARAAFGSAIERASGSTESSLEEAQRVSEAALQRIAESFITASVMTQGDPRLKAGMVVALRALASRFDGSYRLQRVTHTLGAGQSYRTSFQARRLI